jgi:hypothetical protein
MYQLNPVPHIVELQYIFLAVFRKSRYGVFLFPSPFYDARRSLLLDMPLLPSILASASKDIIT